MRIVGDDEARFWSHTKRLKNGCLEWTGALTSDGYAWWTVGGKQQRVHQWAYEHFVGPVPKGCHLDHVCHGKDRKCRNGQTCRHRRCVDWTHLEPVAPLVNAQRGWRPTSTRCKQGHPYTQDNTTTGPRGERTCRTCKREWSRRHYRKYKDRWRKGGRYNP